MNDDLTILASAYLDGAATADERAVVEADASLLAEVERLRQVRAVLGDIEAAPISMRERHLAAALDVWDNIPAPERSIELLDATPAGGDAAAVAGAASVTSAISLDSRRRARRSRGVLAMAAGLVIVLAGGLVARSVLRTSDDSTDVADAPPVEQSSELSQRAELEVAAADETFGDEATEAAPAATAAASDAADRTSGDFIGSDEAPLDDDDLTVLTSAGDLAVFADLLAREATPTESITEGTDVATAEVAPAFPDCDLVGRIVGPALWESDGLFDTVVVVGINDDTGEAVAYESETCTEVARTPLLTP